MRHGLKANRRFLTSFKRRAGVVVAALCGGRGVVTARGRRHRRLKLAAAALGRAEIAIEVLRWVGSRW